MKPFYTSLRKGDNHLQHNSFDLSPHGPPDTSHIFSHTRPRPPCGSLTFHDLLCKRTHPYTVTILPIGSGYFRAKPPTVSKLQLFSNLVIIRLLAYEDGTDSVPKRRHIKFRHRGITQKKTHNIAQTTVNKYIARNLLICTFLKLALYVELR